MKLRFKLILTLFLAAGYSGISVSQNIVNTPQAKAELDTMLLLIGDHLKLQIDVTGHDTAFVQFPVFTDTVVKNVELLKDLPFDTLNDNGLVTIRKQYILTSFDSGYYHIKPLAVILRYGKSRIDTIFTNPMFFGVQTIQIDSTENRVADIKLPIDTPLTISEFFSEYFPYMITILVVIVLGLVTLWLVKNRKKNIKETIIEIPKEEAHVIALRELDSLAEQKLWQKGLVKDYYTGLSETIRRYIEHRFHILALESSTSDITHIVKSQKIIDKTLQPNLTELLETADLVKFAKHEPLASDHIKYLEQAYYFVKQTKIEIIEGQPKVDEQEINNHH